jgi:hypothetical protein
MIVEAQATCGTASVSVLLADCAESDARCGAWPSGALGPIVKPTGRRSTSPPSASFLLFNKVKQCWGLITRFEKHDTDYLDTALCSEGMVQARIWIQSGI